MSPAGPMLELEQIETYRGPAQILRSVSLTGMVLTVMGGRTPNTISPPCRSPSVPSCVGTTTIHVDPFQYSHFASR